MTTQTQMKKDIEHLEQWLLEFIKISGIDYDLEDVYDENCLQLAYDEIEDKILANKYKAENLESQLKNVLHQVYKDSSNNNPEIPKF